MHARLAEEVNVTNRKYKAEFNEKVKARKAVEVENQSQLMEARMQHKARLEELATENEMRMRLAQEEHQVGPRFE